jgi:hypothetical protein
VSAYDTITTYWLSHSVTLLVPVRLPSSADTLLPHPLLATAYKPHVQAVQL